VTDTVPASALPFDGRQGPRSVRIYGPDQIH